MHMKKEGRIKGKIRKKNTDKKRKKKKNPILQILKMF